MKPRILCPYCNAELRWGDKFCGSCGKPIELSDSSPSPNAQQEPASDHSQPIAVTCKSCGTANKPGTEYCRSCGLDLRTQAEPTGATKQTVAKASRKEQRTPHREAQSSFMLGSWRPAAVLVVIVGAAIAIDLYVSKENIPENVVAQQTAEPQQPTGANMAVLPQIEDMERQVKANPGDVATILQLANFLSDNRFFDKALTYYQSYLQKKPKDTNARVDMGICYKEVGQYDNAIREMKQALEYDPTHLFATFNLGIVDLDEGKMYMDQGQMDKANELIKESNDWFKKTVDLAPTSEVGKRAQQLLSQHSNTQLPPSN